MSIRTETNSMESLWMRRGLVFINITSCIFLSILDEFPEKLRTAFDPLPFQICFRKFIQYAKKEASCSLVWPFVGAHQHLTLPWSSPLSLSFKRKHCLFKSVKIAFFRLVAEQWRVGFVHFGALLFVHTYISWCGTGFFWRETNWLMDRSYQ